MIVSVIASFTICAMLGIDLGRIPQEVYPFVVLGIGPENM
jgi:Sterol-sensing domain of SREBP cleavage-activation